MNGIDRRHFLKGMLGTGAMSAFGGASCLYSGVARAAAPAFGDYKALVVLYLFGGNDSYNMMVPLGPEGGNSDYATYKASRGDIAINNNALTPDVIGSNPYAVAMGSDADKYLSGLYQFPEQNIGINAMMPEFAQLMVSKKAAIVANVGSLVEPVNKENFREKRLPPFLFAHNHQTRAMETGWADNLGAMGWAGRIADLWGAHTESGVNSGSPLGLGVSFSGNSRLLTGRENSPAVLSPNSSQLFATGSGFDTATFRQMNEELAGDHPLRRVLKKANRKAADLSDILANEFAGIGDFDGEDPYGNPLFSNPGAEQLKLSRRLSGRTLTSMHAAARMIRLGRDTPGIDRQIIYVGMGGFDNHSDLTGKHPLLLREISLPLWSFQKAMESIEGLAGQVMVTTMSDFGRTLGNNGDGTDHAWAGNNLIMGGGIDGGRRLGQLPDMNLGGASDISSGASAKGRLIPTTAVDQVLASAASWFGVPDTDMPTIFPNIRNFETTPGDIKSAYVPLKAAGGAGPDPDPEPFPPTLPLPLT